MVGMFKRFKNFYFKKDTFNYVFFLSFFGVLFLLNTLHFLMSVQGSSSIRWFFWLYAVGELFLETLALMVVGRFLRKFIPQKFYYGYIGLIFVFLILQIMESVLIKLMDLSLIDAYYTVFGADFANFIELLELTEMGISTWIVVFVTLLLFPLLGIFLYKVSYKFCEKKQHTLKRGHLLNSILLAPLALLALDYHFHDRLKQEDYQVYKKTLPWKTTFFRAPSLQIPLASSLKPLQSAEEILQETALYDLKKEHRPNIYLFIVESLRGDYVTAETAPHLMDFQKNYISSDLALSGANATHCAWFSIFHAKYPFYWSYKDNPLFQRGSFPLHFLKKMGYKVHVYSAAQLRFYHFDEVIFGKNHALADTLKAFPHYGGRSASASDTFALQAFQTDLLHHETNGHCYIFFLDSTHFNYSWPDDFSTKFTPVGEVTWGQRLSNDPDKLCILKNRYKNSIAFVDELFHRALLSIKKKGGYEESIIIFSPDHGEEFKEEGRLFHASHLSSMQTTIPLFYKFGSLHKRLTLTSHLDIFPSILHYLDQDTRLLKYLDGYSIFDDTNRRFAIVGRYNSCLHPYEFLLHNGKDYLKLKLNKQEEIFKATALKVLGYYSQGNPIKASFSQVLEEFQEPLSKVFEIKP